MAKNDGKSNPQLTRFKCGHGANKDKPKDLGYSAPSGSTMYDPKYKCPDGRSRSHNN